MRVARGMNSVMRKLTFDNLTAQLSRVVYNSTFCNIPVTQKKTCCHNNQCKQTDCYGNISWGDKQSVVPKCIENIPFLSCQLPVYPWPLIGCLWWFHYHDVIPFFQWGTRQMGCHWKHVLCWQCWAKDNISKTFHKKPGHLLWGWVPYIRMNNLITIWNIEYFAECVLWHKIMTVELSVNEAFGTVTLTPWSSSLHGHKPKNSGHSQSITVYCQSTSLHDTAMRVWNCVVL